MVTVQPPPTSPSLLGRLQRAPTDQAAWAEFVDRYGRLIYDWCRQWRLQDADACDVTQEVLARLARRMRDFHYDPAGSFHRWLKTLTHHALSDFAARKQRTEVGGGDSQVLELLDAAEARDDLARRLEEEFDRELLERAMARVRARSSLRTWQAFRLLAVEGRSGAQAASQLRMKVATVFVARSKVQHMLAQEVARLQRPGQEEEP